MNSSPTRTDGSEECTLPTVTVIMPVRNESTYIDASLSAVVSQNYPQQKLQILVVDGRSDDDTRARVRHIAEAHSTINLEVVDNPGRIAPCALNRGLQRATGEVIVRVDGHCQIGTDYIRNGVAHLAAGEADGVGGVLETIGETEEAQAIAVAMSSRFGVGGSAFRTSAPDAPARLVDTVAFPAYRREVLDQAGPFDEELVRNQDDEYNYRLRKAGRRILLVPDMPVRYASRARLKALFRQYYQYGFWKVRVLQKHPKQMSLRQFIPPLLVLSFASAPVCGWLLATLFRTTAGWLAVIPAGLYGIANLAASVAESRRRAVRLSPLAVAFALMHMGYGAGFLVGLVRFVGRWQWRRKAASE